MATKKPSKAKTTTKRVTKQAGTTACGTHLKKGFKYVKGGGIVKVTKVAAKKKK